MQQIENFIGGESDMTKFEYQMQDIFAQKGWICPKCGRVLAPSTMYCLWCCSDMKESITTTGTTIPKWDTTPIKVGSRQTDCPWGGEYDQDNT